MAEKDLKNPLTLDDRGQSSVNPVAGDAFIAGASGCSGCPTWGIPGRGVYFAGCSRGLVLGIAMALARLALLYYVRVIHGSGWASLARKQKFKIQTVFLIVWFLSLDHLVDNHWPVSCDSARNRREVIN